MRNCCKVPSTLSARHLTLIHNKMSLTVNPCTWRPSGNAWQWNLLFGLALVGSWLLAVGCCPGCCLKWRRQPTASMFKLLAFFFPCLSSARFSFFSAAPFLQFFLGFLLFCGYLGFVLLGMSRTLHLCSLWTRVLCCLWLRLCLWAVSFRLVAIALGNLC